MSLASNVAGSMARLKVRRTPETEVVPLGVAAVTRRAGGAATPCRALLTLSRRPLTVRPDSDAMGSPVSTIRLMTWAEDRPRFCDQTRAMAPVTWGVAIEVPLKLS